VAEPDKGELVAWVRREGKAGGLPPESVPLDQRPISVPADGVRPGTAARGAYLPLHTNRSLEGVLVAVPSHPGGVAGVEARLLAALANLSASCLERQRLERAAADARALREAERLKDTLVSSVSHELKTPLAAATARVTGLLEEGALADPDRARRQLSSVESDLRTLDSSIGDLLDISRLESASWQPRLERLDVRELLGTVLARLPVEQRARVRFELADLVPDVCVDGPQLVRALANVVGNALAYSPVGSPVVVTVVQTREGGVEVAVKDSGPGIADAEKPRVFEKFFRGAASSSAPHGSGLGLTIAAEIVRSHGGAIRLEDARPQGARVVIVLRSADSETR
jgi:two-component system sensor histidine kinase KdpD